MKKIVVVGGGAGGLELATRLGRKLGRKNRAQVLLIDRNRTHLWKPLLHEVAAGSMDSGMDALGYSAHGIKHGYRFQLGELTAINREHRRITLAPMTDDEGNKVLNQRQVDYDILVLSIGSVSNDFGTLGVEQHCIFLDRPDQAERFHLKLLNNLLQLSEGQTDAVRVSIVGAGATGVELSAELFNAVKQVRHYGFDHVEQDNLKVTLIEAGDTILPALPERISSAAHDTLIELGTDIRVETTITEATADGLRTRSGELIRSDLMVWAAGVKAPAFLAEFGGLETNGSNQLVVSATLQTTRDENIYAFGDCAEFLQPNGDRVPPRAQAAHQMATCAAQNIVRRLAGKQQRQYEYRDYGSLVSLSRYTTVGSLMGNLMRGSMMIEGLIARIVYISLYRMHQVALHGYLKTFFMTVVGTVNRVLRPSLKLH